MGNETQTKVCKHCQTEIPKKAKVCPNCRKKQGGILKWIIIAVLVIAVISSVAGGDDEKESGQSSSNQNQETEVKQEEQATIEYMSCSVGEMMDLLEGNALKAESTYQDKYVEITGRLSNIDSDGKYISIVDQNDEWAILGIQCYLTTDEQREQVMEMSVDDIVTLRGKIKSVGEVLGYSLDIDSIN